MPRTALLTIALVATLALAGCAPSAGPVAEPDVPVVTPSPTPTQARETGLVPPARVFGGDCDALFTDAELSEVFGVAMVRGGTEGRGATDFRRILTEQLGGMTCGWYNDGGADRAVGITVAPVGSVGPVGPAECASDRLGVVCNMDEIVNGMRFVGEVSYTFTASDTPLSKVQAVTEAVTALFAAKGTAAEVVPAPLPAEGAWVNPADCVAVDGAITSPTFLDGAPRTPVEQSGGLGDYVSPIDTAAAGADVAHPHFSCRWLTEPNHPELALTVDFLGGGAWTAGDIVDQEDATVVTVAGAEKVYLFGGGSLLVIDGPNAMLVESPNGNPGRSYSSIPLIIDALNSLSN
jgi:hypothetical protein